MKRDPLRSLVLRLSVVTVAVLLVMAALASWHAFQRFDPVFTPELSRKAATVGQSLRVHVERAIGYGIPLDKLPGVDELFTGEVRAHPEIAYIVLTGPDGRVLAQGGGRIATGQTVAASGGPLVEGYLDTVLPLGDETVGKERPTLHIGIDPAYLAKASVDLMLDVLSVLVVSVLLTFEVLLLVVNLAMARVSALRHAAERAEAGDFRSDVPHGGDRGLVEVADACRDMLDRVNARFAALSNRMAAARPDARAEGAFRELQERYTFRKPQENARAPVNLVFLRLPVFLFCLSEELSRPFLPAYAQSFAASVPWLTPDLVVSAPITLFMLVWAFSQPGGARWSERWGRQRAFLFGALLGSISLALTAYATTLWDLMLWRCLTALGYGLVLITAQGMVIDHTSRDNRASGMATFIGGLLAAGVCGPVTGGIIADQIGFRSTFLIGAVLALASGMAITVLFSHSVGPDRKSVVTLTTSAALGLARNVRFLVLMLLSAIPTKIAATGVLFCLIPLMLSAEGATKAEVGRVQMMYFVAFILVSPLAAGLSDRLQARRGFIVLGGIGTLASCVPLMFVHDWWGAPLGIGLFGLSQALVSAPQLTLVSQLAQDANLSETAAIGWYRLLERFGGALGPMVAMALSITYSYREALVGVGVLCGVSAVLFWLAFRSGPKTRPVPLAQEA